MSHYGQYTNRIFDSHFISTHLASNVQSWPASSLPHTPRSSRLNISGLQQQQQQQQQQQYTGTS